MTARWGERDIPSAQHLWRQIMLVCGGTPANRRHVCRTFYLGICDQSDYRQAEPAQEKMPCACRHWLNLTERQRRILIASRAGLPIGLIALLAEDESPKAIAAQIAAVQGMAEVEPLKSYVERITERVPMWGERRRMPLERAVHAAGV